MGYYIDLVFDRREHLDCEAVIEKFRNVGAKRVPDEDIGPSAERVVDLLWWDKDYAITVITICKKKPDNFKGNWASIRMSWAETPESMQNQLRDILELADMVGCRVYDGQISEYLTKDNLERVRDKFAKTAGIVIGMIGKTQRH